VAVGFLAAITVGSLLLARRTPYVVVGWLWFIVAMLPVSGIVQIGRQLIADRYAYIPFIGLYIAIVWLVNASLERQSIRAIQGSAPAAMAIIITMLAYLTHQQTHMWRDGGTLFSTTIARTDRNWMAHSNLAAYLDRNGRLSEALPHFRFTTEFCRECGWTYARYGEALLRYNQVKEARANLERAVALDERDVRSAMNLGVALVMLGEPEQAVVLMKRAVEADPNSAAGRENLAQRGEPTAAGAMGR
jgi:Tfp pilus assembly protein PilF